MSNDKDISQTFGVKPNMVKSSKKSLEKLKEDSKFLDELFCLLEKLPAFPDVKNNTNDFMNVSGIINRMFEEYVKRKTREIIKEEREE